MTLTASTFHADTLVRRCDTLRRTTVLVAACALTVLAGCSSGTSDRTTEALDESWANMDAQEQAGFCAEVRLDLDGAIATYMGAQPEFDIVAVRDWLVDRCDA